MIVVVLGAQRHHEAASSREIVVLKRINHGELSVALMPVAKFDLHLSLDLKRNGGERHGRIIWFRIIRRQASKHCIIDP